MKLIPSALTREFCFKIIRIKIARVFKERPINWLSFVETIRTPLYESLASNPVGILKYDDGLNRRWIPLAINVTSNQIILSMSKVMIYSNNKKNWKWKRAYMNISLPPSPINLTVYAYLFLQLHQSHQTLSSHHLE